ncbi:MAG: hypothetical protein HY865_11310 [Chloroflexi bacterium]|nr:hypothetical protein [Chloroflexota bacterium]
MIQFLLIGVMFFTGLGVYYVLKTKVVEPLLLLMINGLFENLYLKYIQNSVKSFFTLQAEPNPDSAWNQVAYAKIYEIGLRSVETGKKIQNISYLRNMSLEPALIDELIEIIPDQNDRNVQIKLLGFIQDALKKISSQGTKNSPQKTKNSLSPRVTVENWAGAFSAWLTGTFLALYIWFTLDNYDIYNIIVIGVFLCVFMSWPIIKLAVSGFAKLSSVWVVITTVLLILGVRSLIFHSEVNKVTLDLKQYGYPGDTIIIRHPTWLTVKDIDSCDPRRSIATQIVSQNSLTLEFDYDRNYILMKNDSCHAAYPQFTSNSFELFAAPLGRKSLEQQSYTKITPMLIDGTKKIPLDELIMNIRMEHPFWDHLFELVGAVTGSYGVLAVVKWLVERKKSS